jgi:hypothetical protein
MEYVDINPPSDAIMNDSITQREVTGFTFRSRALDTHLALATLR